MEPDGATPGAHGHQDEPVPGVPVPGCGTRSAQRRGRRVRGAGGLCRALPISLLPVSNAQSIPMLLSTAGVGDREASSPLTPPHLSTPTASLNPRDAPPLIPQINWDVGMTARLQGQPWRSCCGGQGKGQGGHSQGGAPMGAARAPPWGPGALGCPGELAPQSWDEQGVARPRISRGAQGHAGGSPMV